MEPSRRDVVVGALATGLAACAGEIRPPKDVELAPAPDREPEPGPWSAPGTLDPVRFPLGVAAGDPSDQGVILSVPTSEVGLTAIVVAQKPGALEWEEVLRIEGIDATGWAAQVAIPAADLRADAVHRYTFTTADGSWRSEIGRFRTPPGFRKVVIGASSCWGSINPTFPTLGIAAAAQLDAMLLLGDAIYADGAVTLDDYRDEWASMLDKDQPRALFQSTGVIATWDDHEVDNNWVLNQTVTPVQVADARQAFREAIPQRAGSPEDRLWRVVGFGEVVDVFVLDSRGERTPTQIVSPAQLAGMVRAIRDSTAAFKLILCSVHLTDHSQVMGAVESVDRWQGYPAQRLELVEAVADTPGALVITGDMHFSAIQTVGLPGDPGDAVTELAVGPAGSRVVPMKEVVALAEEEAPQYRWLGTSWTVTVLTLDPGTGEVTAEFIDDDGVVVGSERWIP